MKIISDLDGTLLNDNGEIGEFTMNVIKNFKSDIFFATGRSYSNIPLFLKFKNNFSITMNGASILKNGKEIYSKNLLKSEIKHIISSDLAKKSESILLENNFNFTFLKPSRLSFNFFDNEKKVKKIDDPKSLIIIIYNNLINDIDYIGRFKEFQISTWKIKDGYTAIEFQSIYAQKSEAIGWMINNNILEKFIYFGDSNNDISVLEKYPESFYKMKDSIITNNKINSKVSLDINNRDGVAKTIISIYKGDIYGNYR